MSRFARFLHKKIVWKREFSLVFNGPVSNGLTKYLIGLLLALGRSDKFSLRALALEFLLVHHDA